MNALATPRALPPAVSVSDAERAHLLAVARFAVAAAIRGDSESAIELAARDAAWGHCGGAFVTLRNHGDLRGCIGLLDPSRPLTESVALAAFGAARHDGRFRALSEAELPSLEVEVSVLGPFATLDDPLAFRLGVDGLMVQRGWSRGLLLPDVATMHGLDSVAMLEATCEKAGLRPDAWRDNGTTVSAFRTDRFGGPAIA
jgi:AmmeMemoRadiSam system protein A